MLLKKVKKTHKNIFRKKLKVDRFLISKLNNKKEEGGMPKSFVDKKSFVRDYSSLKSLMISGMWDRMASRLAPFQADGTLL